MIDQSPHVIQIVAERIRPTVRTPFGTYQFHRLDPTLIGGYGPYRNTGNFDIATPAQSLFDALYLSTRRGRRLRHFPELSWPANFSLVANYACGWQRSTMASYGVAVTERGGMAFFAAQVAAMNSKEIYVSTDVEADGPIPGPNSMLSFGSAAYTGGKELIGTFSANLETLPLQRPNSDPKTGRMVGLTARGLDRVPARTGNA